jgi:hypothetical protein
MSPMTFTQQGVVTQYEVAKILIVSSGGMLEVSLPLTDDERRDMEIHIRGRFGNFALQIKSTMHLDHRFKAYQLSMFFSVPKAKLITHPHFWYFFGYFDVKAMAFSNPVFIVPSAEVHKHASPRLDGERWTFNFSASLDPNSHDHWVPFRRPTDQVGPQVLDILEAQQAGALGAPFPAELAALDGIVLVGRARPADSPVPSEKETS